MCLQAYLLFKDSSQIYHFIPPVNLQVVSLIIWSDKIITLLEAQKIPSFTKAALEHIDCRWLMCLKPTLMSESRINWCSICPIFLRTNDGLDIDNIKYNQRPNSWRYFASSYVLG